MVNDEWWIMESGVLGRSKCTAEVSFDPSTRLRRAKPRRARLRTGGGRRGENEDREWV